MTALFAPFLIGLAGSLHCIGMCSPLVMAVSNAGKNAIFRNLQYNLGRILTYATMGSVVSFAGAGLHMAGIQQWVSATAGLVLLAIGITNFRVTSPGYLQGYIGRFSMTLKTYFGQLLSKRNAFSIVTLGMINGLLPCGMTLIALGYCLTLAGPSDGFLAMLLFGLGTLPSMVGFAAISKSMVSKLGIRYSKLQGGLIIICAIILIGRGIWRHESPKARVAEDNSGIVSCGSDNSR